MDDHPPVVGLDTAGKFLVELVSHLGDLKMEKIVIETENGTFTIREEYNEYGQNGVERHEWTLYDSEGEEVCSFESAQFAEEYVFDNY